MRTTADHEQFNILRQPKAVWAVAFACVIAFMGIGLVDPILPALGKSLHATPSQAEGVAVDARGNIYGAEVGARTLRRYVKP